MQMFMVGSNREHLQFHWSELQAHLALCGDGDQNEQASRALQV